jgi:hypothetical protein
MKTATLAIAVLVLGVTETGCKKKEPETITNTVTNTSTVYGSLEQGLIFSYDFTGSLLDGSSNANDLEAGTSYNYTYTTDRNGNAGRAVSFSGSGALILPGNQNYKVQFPFTVSFWTNMADSSSINNRFIWNDGSVVYAGFFIQSHPNGSGTLVCSYGDGTGTSSMSRRSAYSSVVLRSNHWHHVTVVYKSATETQIFIDGVKDANVSYDGDATTIVYGSAPGEIGHLPGNSYFLNGKMDKVKMWNRALGSDEISAEYSSTF